MLMLETLKQSRLGSRLRPLWIYAMQIFGRKNSFRSHEWVNMKRLIVNDPVLNVPSFGGVFQVPVASHLFPRLVETGEYEPEALAILREHESPDKDAIEVGANIGFFTCLLATYLQSGRVLSVEPTPGAHRRLVANVARNNLNQKVIVFNGALADKPGVLDIEFIEDREEFSSLGGISHYSVRNDQNRTRIPVNVSTIDELVREHGLNPGLIKIDVEGAEGLVLKGATETLKSFRPVVFAEFSRELLAAKGFKAESIVAELKAMGYSVCDPFHSSSPAGSRAYGDILAVPNR
jgi:FkbM family methyltransferase